MPKLSVTVPHELPQDEAAERLQGFADKIKQKYGDQIKDLQEEFSGHSGTFSFSVIGFKVGGTIELKEKDVTVDCDLPLAAMMIKGRIESELRESLKRTLA